MFSYHCRFQAISSDYASSSCGFVEWQDTGVSTTVIKEFAGYVKRDLGPNVNIDLKVFTKYAKYIKVITIDVCIYMEVLSQVFTV